MCGSPDNGADVEDPTFILPIQRPRQLHGHKGRHHYPNPKTVNRPDDVWGRGGERAAGAERREGEGFERRTRRGWSVWDGRGRAGPRGRRLFVYSGVGMFAGAGPGVARRLGRTQANI